MTPLVYALNNGHLGTIEQMGLAILDGLSDEFVPYVFAPEGEVIDEARKMGFITQTFTSLPDFTMKLWMILSKNTELNFITADSKLSFSALFINFFLRRRVTHLQLVTEESTENLSGRLNKYEVIFVTLSKYIKQKLIAQGARQERVRVIESFLPERTRKTFSRRPKFQRDGVKKITIVLRKEVDKKIELLLDAIDRSFALRSLEFKIYADEHCTENLKRCIENDYKNLVLQKIDENTLHKLSEADLYLHLCPEETFDLAVLAALAADVPVLVPDAGDKSPISHNINGFTYEAEDSLSLSERLTELSNVTLDLLNAIVKGGRHLLKIRFSNKNGVEKYRRLIHQSKILEIDLARGKLIL